MKIGNNHQEKKKACVYISAQGRAALSSQPQASDDLGTARRLTQEDGKECEGRNKREWNEVAELLLLLVSPEENHL